MPGVVYYFNETVGIIDEYGDVTAARRSESCYRPKDYWYYLHRLPTLTAHHPCTLSCVFLIIDELAHPNILVPHNLLRPPLVVNLQP